MDGRFGFFKILTAISILAFLTPQQISRYHFVSDLILDLKISKKSPPIAILEDESLPYVNASVPMVAAGASSVGTLLKAEKQIQKNLEVLAGIAQDFKTHQKAAPMAPSPTRTIRSLSGMKLDKNSPNIAQFKKVLGADIKSEISAPLKARVEAVEEEDGYVDAVNDFIQEETFADYAERVVAAEVARPEPVAAKTFVPSTSTVKSQSSETVKSNPPESPQVLFSFPSWMVGASGNTEISKTSQAATATIGQKAKSLAQAKLKPESTQHPNLVAMRSGFMKKEEAPVFTAASASSPSANLYQQSLSQAFIAGSLEMVQGMVLTGDEQVSVFHQVGGSVVGYGNVKLDQGRFEIFVQNPRSGVLVAEVARGDQVLGRAEILLPELLMSHKNSGELKETLLQIRPVYDTIVANARDGYVTPKFEVSKIVLNETLPLKRKSGSFSGTVLESTVISKTEKPGHWGSLVFGSSKQKFEHTLFADSTVQALYGISQNRYSKQSGSAYGTVKLFGKPVAGAKVEILNSNVSEANSKPIYFNSFLPDGSLEQTTESGTFAFVGLEPGTYVLRAQLKGKYLSSQTITVENAFISQVDFDVQKARLAEAFVYDLRTSQSVDADLGFLGSEKFVKSKAGRQLISLSGTEGIQILEARAHAEEYYTTRMTLDKSQKEILLPMIHQDWISDLMTRAKMNILPETGMAIGLSQQTAFKVEIDDGAYNDETKIVYFDQNGQILEGATAAPAGGGVILVNLNSGMRSVFVKYQGSQAVKLVSMVVDSSAVNVFNSPF